MNKASYNALRWTLTRLSRHLHQCTVIGYTLIAACECLSAIPPERPNIILVLADDVGWSDMGYAGATFYETPHIDQLASEGMRFDRFYPGGPNCAPTRACLMTGMYTPRHELYQPGGKSKGALEKMRWDVPTRGRAHADAFVSRVDEIDAQWTSVAEVLGGVGYATARLGKWHLGPDTQGFDLSSNDGLTPYTPDNDFKYYRDVSVAERLTDRALQFIDDNADQPFFLYLSHWEAHTPLKAKESLVQKYREKKGEMAREGFPHNPAYAAELEVIDRSVGRLRSRLSKLGIAEQTVFVFTSDNGGVPSITSNAPLRGGKGSLFEGGVRTPMVVAWPGVVSPGSIVDIPVSGVDLLPSFAELGNAPLPPNQPVDGVSILPLLMGRALRDRAIFWHYPLYLSGGKGGKILPVYGGNELYWRAVPASAVVDGDWKLIYFYEYESYQLYNLRDDPGEVQDLSTVEVAKAKALFDTLIRWVKKTNAPVPNKPNPNFTPVRASVHASE